MFDINFTWLNYFMQWKDGYCYYSYICSPTFFVKLCFPQNWQNRQLYLDRQKHTAYHRFTSKIAILSHHPWKTLNCFSREFFWPTSSCTGKTPRLPEYHGLWLNIFNPFCLFVTDFNSSSPFALNAHNETVKTRIAANWSNFAIFTLYIGRNGLTWFFWINDDFVSSLLFTTKAC